MIILEDCSLYEYTPKVNRTFGAFDCGEEDLNNFFIAMQELLLCQGGY